MRNRIVTVLLIAALLLSSLTLPAAAAGDVAVIGTTGYSSLQAAVDAYGQLSSIFLLHHLLFSFILCNYLSYKKETYKQI